MRKHCSLFLFSVLRIAGPLFATTSVAQNAALPSREVSEKESDDETFLEALQRYKRVIDETSEHTKNRHLSHEESDFSRRELQSGISSSTYGQSSSCSSGSNSGSGSRCSESHDATLEGSFLGACVLISGGFYLVNLRNDHIRQLTWETISVAISIFCAIVIFFSLNDMFLLIVGQGDTISHRRLSVAFSHPAGQGRRLGTTACGGAVITVKMILVLSLFMVVEVSLLTLRNKKIHLAAWGLIGAHLVGFSVAEAFGNIQVCSPFKEGVGLTLLVVIMALLSLIVLFMIGGYLRWRVVEMDDVITQSERRWLHQCEHSEDEFLAFGIGFLFSISVRYAIAGEVPDLHDVPKDRSGKESIVLLSVCVIFGVVVPILGIITHRMQEAQMKAWQIRAAECSELVFAMTTGWLLLWWGKWSFWAMTDGTGLEGGGDVLSARLAMVFLFTMLTVAAIFVLDKMAVKFPCLLEGLRALMEAFLLMLGLAWEGVFMSVMDGMVANISNRIGKCLYSSLMGITVCCVVIPAWVLYILPHALEHSDEDHGGISLSHPEMQDHRHQAKVKAAMPAIQRAKTLGTLRTEKAAQKALYDVDRQQTPLGVLPGATTADLSPEDMEEYGGTVVETFRPGAAKQQMSQLQTEQTEQAIGEPGTPTADTPLTLMDLY